MSVDADQFIIDFPQFEAIDTDTIESAIATAIILANDVAWGPLANRAQSLLVAHMLAVQAQAAANDGRNTGNLTGISVPNEISMQFSQTAVGGGKGQEGYKATVYGQQFLQLQQSRFVPFLIV